MSTNSAPFPEISLNFFHPVPTNFILPKPNGSFPFLLIFYHIHRLKNNRFYSEVKDFKPGDRVVVPAIRGASEIYAVGSRPNCIEIAKKFGATHIINYRNESIEEQVMNLTSGNDVDKVVIAGGDVDTFATAINVLKPGGKIGNVNYIGEGDYIKIPRVEWGCGMGHKQIAAGLMPGGRLRMEKLISLIETKRICPSRLVTHQFHGFDKVEEALLMMKDKPKDLIKPIVFID